MGPPEIFRAALRTLAKEREKPTDTIRERRVHEVLDVAKRLDFAIVASNGGTSRRGLLF
jgi:hypothetical protein